MEVIIVVVVGVCEVGWDVGAAVDAQREVT